MSHTLYVFSPEMSNQFQMLRIGEGTMWQRIIGCVSIDIICLYDILIRAVTIEKSFDVE